MQKYTPYLILSSIILLAWSLANILFSIQILNEKIDNLGLRLKVTEASMSAIQTNFEEWEIYEKE